VRIIALALAAVLISGFGAASAQTTKSCPHFVGTWPSDYGSLTLKAEPIADRKDAYIVSGWYPWQGYSARISGTLNGDTLVGRWIQHDRWGYLNFVLSPDRTGFVGTWIEANKSGGGRWNGHCSS
jgi:hypothetical protein